MTNNKQKSERLTVLSELEEFGFYGLPDFDDDQRLTYFAFEEKEWELISQCPALRTQVTCALLGRTDLEIEISNQCGVLIAIAIIYYNNFLQSSFLDKNLSKKNLKALKKSSPVVWKHIHFIGHFTFYDHKKKIDIEKIIEKIEI